MSRLECARVPWDVTTRRLLAAVAVLGMTIMVLMAGAASADAHASLASSDPSDGAVLADPPDVAAFTFNEPVSTTTGALRVYDDTGARVDDGVLDQSAPDSVEVGLGSLPAGGYVATYRVTSDDGHVIRGALTFRVGDTAEVDDDTVAALFAGGDGVVTATATVVRAVDLGAALVALGALAAAAGIVATERHRRLATDTTRRAALVGVVASALTVPLQAMASSGLGVAALGSTEVLADTVTGTVGVSALTRIAGLVLVLAVVHPGAREHGAGSRSSGPRGGAWTAIGAGLLVLGSFLLDGHTRTVGPPVVMLVGDAVHLAAGAVWAGGLVVVARVLRGLDEGVATPGLPGPSSADVPALDPGPVVAPATAATDGAGGHGVVATTGEHTGLATVTTTTGARVVDEPGTETGLATDASARPAADGVDPGTGGDDSHAVAAVVARFSGWAWWSMLALVVAGSAMGWALVRRPRALVGTDQGWTLVVKVGIVVVILLVAAWNRWRLVPAVAGTDPDGTSPAVALAHLRSSVRVEVVLLAVVLATTAVLVGLRPAAEEAGISGAFDTVVALGDDASLNLVVDPNRAGRNEVHVYVLDATGRPLADATDVTMDLEQVEADIGPLQRTPRPAGPGHWILDGSDLAVPGTWEVTTIVGVDRFTQVQATVEVVVNPG